MVSYVSKTLPQMTLTMLNDSGDKHVKAVEKPTLPGDIKWATVLLNFSLLIRALKDAFDYMKIVWVKLMV